MGVGHTAGGAALLASCSCSPLTFAATRVASMLTRSSSSLSGAQIFLRKSSPVADLQAAVGGANKLKEGKLLCRAFSRLRSTQVASLSFQSGQLWSPAGDWARAAPGQRLAGLGDRCQHGRRQASGGVVASAAELVDSSSAAGEVLPKDVPAPTASSSSSSSGDSIRRTFLRFFEERGHAVLPSSSLVPRKVPRATTSQKCVRTNDVENVGRTARHHTFFEMLGNFSFGDYFKRDAIKWAWELAISEYKLPVEQVWVSVFEDDDEAYAIWRDEVGVSEARIQRMGADDNFWASGATGPCGPCSEMYFDFHPERGTHGADLGDDSRFIEFYNLVFMQYNRQDDGALEPLKNRHIDTGMGLERMAQILQKVPNNYETDLIYPMIEKAAQLAGVEYSRANEHVKTQLKVIGDHTRAVVYLISDGVAPSNVGRGYVVRRLIRRVVRMGRLLGIRGDGAGNPDGTFLPAIARQVVALSKLVDPEVEGRAAKVYDELHREELKFVQTLERGDRLLEDLLQAALASPQQPPLLRGKDVFTLYDTFGFPVEITEEVAAERGVGVDMEGFRAEMEVQRKQSQAAHSAVKLAVGGAAADLAQQLAGTTFVGYTELQASATVAAVLAQGAVVEEAGGEGQEVDVVLDTSPFYGESGGQVGDCGVLEMAGPDGEVAAVLRVRDVQKAGGELLMHRATVERGSVRPGQTVLATVDRDARKRAMAHHTATHLLQAALKQVLGGETSQAGSLVAFDRLRFDFNSARALGEEELARIEGMVNAWIGRAVPLQSTVMPIAEAKAAGAIAMFGEKCEWWRCRACPWSCVAARTNTAEILGFKIVSEAGIASGVRRIEAVAGPAAIQYLSQRDAVVRALSSALKVKAEEVPARVSGLQEELRAARSEAAELKAALAVSKAELLADKAVVLGASSTRVLVAPLENVDPESLKLAAERLLERLGDPAAVVLGSPSGDGKVSIVATFSPQVVKAGLHAGKFVGAVAKLCGGGGGGRPNLAQAGGKQPEKLSEALEKARKDIEDSLASK
eukprot:jgi/Mesen1/7005/ME000365S06144